MQKHDCGNSNVHYDNQSRNAYVLTRGEGVAYASSCVPVVSSSCHSEDTASPVALLLREAERDNNLNTCRISAWVC